MCRTNCFAVAFVAVIVFLAGARSGELHSADDPDNSRLKKLLDDRYKIKKQIVDLLKKPGAGSKVDQYYATIDMLNAELDTCESKAQKLSVLEKIVAEEKAHEQLTRSSDVSQIEVMRARARSLDAQIALEKEKLN